MSHPLPEAEEPLDPAAAAAIARVRRLMLISGLTTMLAVGTIFGIIGYRVFKNEGSATTADVTALLPKGARVVSAAVSNDRIVVTIENGGAIEIRSFDLKTLKPAGRLKFAPEP